MMDNAAYVEKNIAKLDLYEKNGFLIGKNLIITHETSKKPLVVSVVDNYIENFLIFWRDMYGSNGCNWNTEF